MSETPEFGGGCIELTRDSGMPVVSCCGSCHSDWDEGYDEPRDREHGGKLYHVCCAVDIAYENWAAPSSRGSDPA